MKRDQDRGSRQRPQPYATVVITRDPKPDLSWKEASETPFEVRCVSSVEGALLLLPADVIILDRGLEPADTALESLCDRLGHASLLVTTDRFDDRLGRLIDQLGGALCLLSADAPARIQAQVVTMAAERARLHHDLHGRIADLERHSHELEQSRARFRDIIERNADAILVIDRGGMIRFANPMAVQLFRSSCDELVGSHFGYPVTHGETSELDLVGGGAHRLVEMRVVESAWEGVDAYIASLRDITERRRAEENALRLTREQVARGAAEAEAARFHFLADASALLSVPLDYEESVDGLVRLCVSEFADWAAFYVPDGPGRLRVHAIEHRNEEHRHEAQRLIGAVSSDADDIPLRNALRGDRPLLLRDVRDDTIVALVGGKEAAAQLRALGVHALMLVPLIAREHRLGVLVLASATSERRFTDEDLTVAGELGARAALAMDNARLYREARDANEAKTRLLAVISHDLRTPLNAIIGYADLLSMGISGELSDTGMRQIDRMRMSAKHLVFLIDELLSFARLDGGSETLQLEEVDPALIAREAAAVVEPLATQRGLSVYVQTPAASPAIRTDPDRLRQVLLNLVGNAVRYTERGGIRIEVVSEADAVVFRVHDTGIGIEPEHLDHVFEPFWQADPRQRSRDGGTGLGLSVVRRIVDMLNGQISLESEVGRGSTFTVWLPSRPLDRPGAARDRAAGSRVEA